MNECGIPGLRWPALHGPGDKTTVYLVLTLATETWSRKELESES